MVMSGERSQDYEFAVNKPGSAQVRISRYPRQQSYLDARATEIFGWCTRVKILGGSPKASLSSGLTDPVPRRQTMSFPTSLTTSYPRQGLCEKDGRVNLSSRSL